MPRGLATALDRLIAVDMERVYDSVVKMLLERRDRAQEKEMQLFPGRELDYGHAIGDVAKLRFPR